MSDGVESEQNLIQKIRDLGPWHQNIAISETVSTGGVFSVSGNLERAENDGISLLNLETPYKNMMGMIYPDGLGGKRVLDCACNAGGYSFWSRDMGADFCYGFDVREHWINQAQFIQHHRSVGQSDRIRFAIADLYDLPRKKLPKFDVTVFKGIFYHLPDPIHALKIAADMTDEVMFFNTQTAWGCDDGFLQVSMENTEKLMSGSYGLSWRPTGPRVMMPIFDWLGFRSIRLVFFRPYSNIPNLGRMSMFVARDPKLLEPLTQFQELFATKD